ncbi:MAG: RluA family pseudouridine synthase [Planctomycetes bacterium]|nr:RluA family pseudouridine synthase [Planctomycetota bacterium]
MRARGHSRAEVQAWIEAGRVRVRRGGTWPAVKKGLELRAGDAVEVQLPAPPRPPAPLRPEAIPLALLHQDEALLVIDKPAGLTVHPGAGQREHTLAHALLHASAGRLSSVGGEDRPGIVHRLDKDTSGVIVVARDDAAHRHLARQFHDRTVEKTYLALVERGPRADHGVVDAPIGRHPRERKKMAVVEGGRPARTRWRVLERFGARAALVECRPETGRTHQIRVHLKHLHAPLLADPTYGRADRFTAQDAGRPGDDRVLLARHALHAARLVLTHPVTGARLTFEAPLPPDMDAALEALRGG